MEVEGKLADSFRSSNAEYGFLDSLFLSDDEEYLNKGYDSGVTVNSSMANTASKVTFGIICFGVLFPNRSSTIWNFIFGKREKEKRKVGTNRYKVSNNGENGEVFLI